VLQKSCSCVAVRSQKTGGLNHGRLRTTLTCDELTHDHPDLNSCLGYISSHSATTVGEEDGETWGPSQAAERREIGLK
jgi:hypothetical protein